LPEGLEESEIDFTNEKQNMKHDSLQRAFPEWYFFMFLTVKQSFRIVLAGINLFM